MRGKKKKGAGMKRHFGKKDTMERCKSRCLPYSIYLFVCLSRDKTRRAKKEEKRPRKCGLQDYFFLVAWCVLFLSMKCVCELPTTFIIIRT